MFRQHTWPETGRGANLGRVVWLRVVAQNRNESCIVQARHECDSRVSTAPASGEEHHNTRYRRRNQDTGQDGQGGVP